MHEPEDDGSVEIEEVGPEQRYPRKVPIRIRMTRVSVEEAYEAQQWNVSADFIITGEESASEAISRLEEMVSKSRHPAFVWLEE